MAVNKTTLLSGVNHILAAMGSQPVQSLSDSADPEVSAAEAELNRALADLQSQRWWFNFIEDVKLIADNSGEITLPIDPQTMAVSVKPCNMPSTSSENPVVIVERAGKLYDKANDTFDFGVGTEVKCDLTQAVDFEDLPEVARSVVVAEAAFNAAQSLDRDNQLVARLERRYGIALARFSREDKRTGDYNVLNDSLFRRIRRTRPLNRTRPV